MVIQQFQSQKYIAGGWVGAAVITKSARQSVNQARKVILVLLGTIQMSTYAAIKFQQIEIDFPIK